MKSMAAFLEESHHDLWRRAVAWSRAHVRALPEPAGDDEARRSARSALTTLGASGWLEAVRARDLRALCLVRDAVAGDSPLADAVIAIQGLGVTPLLLAGTAAQRDRWVHPLVSGQAMAAFAMSEPGAGSDVAALETRAVRDGDGWVIDGHKHLISNAGLADLYLVFARTAEGRGSRGITCFLVERQTPGLQFEGAQILSAAHPLGRLSFRHCRVGADAVVGDVDAGFKLGMRTLDWLRPTVGAAACGMAARALEEAATHAQARRQFGQPLAAMPLVREKLGRMATALDAARCLVYRAAWQQDQRRETSVSVDRDASAAAAMAKGFATETAQVIVDEAVQIVGGLGVLVGHPVERLYRAVRALRIYEGATDIQRLIVAAHVLDHGQAADAVAASTPGA